MTKSVRYYIQPLDDDQAVVHSVPVARPTSDERARTGHDRLPAPPPVEPAPLRPPAPRSRMARLVRAAIGRDEKR